MKLGFLTGNLGDIEKAARLGFEAVEMAAEAVTAEGGVARVQELLKQHDISITALAYYDVAFNPPAPDQITGAYERVFDAAEALGVNTIASMSGFDAERNWAGNVELFAERFTPVAKAAEQRGLRIAFENWMDCYGSVPIKPRNMGGSPDTWDAWFAAVPSPALGLEFDPSHLYWQGIDHIRALREYKDRVFHVHAKDTEMLPEKLYRGGFNGDYFRFRIPGYGGIDWTQFITVLDEIGYTGGVAIEQEDPIYSGDRFDEGLVRGYQTLQPLIHPASGPRA